MLKRNSMGPSRKELRKKSEALARKEREKKIAVLVDMFDKFIDAYWDEDWCRSNIPFDNIEHHLDKKGISGTRWASFFASMS